MRILDSRIANSLTHQSLNPIRRNYCCIMGVCSEAGKFKAFYLPCLLDV